MDITIGKKINLAIIGMGAMGKGLLYQSLITKKTNPIAVCDIQIEKCIDILRSFELPYEVAKSPSAIEEIIKKGLIAICEDGNWLSQANAIDAIIEATSTIRAAAMHSLSAIEKGKHVILMNSEVDLMFGPVFSDLAKKNGVICTSCDGDQYGIIKHLIEDILSWGFDLVMAGNIKGYLDRYANPRSIVAEADKRNLDYKMCSSYTDGTKLNIEMAIIANAYNLETKTVGMYGPRAAHVNNIFQHFDFHALWNDKRPFVDYILGAEPGGGVFVIGHCDNPYQREMLNYYKMGSGPFYVFYRPYHLCHIEAMNTVIRAVKENYCFLAPNAGMKTNVFAYAKKDLSRGEHLDGIGGFSCYGKIENIDNPNLQQGLPIALAEDVSITRDISKDEKINFSDIAYDNNRIDYKLYSEALKIF